MFLTSTADLINVITDAAADIEVHSCWVDKATATEPVAGRLNTAHITTATTTTIVPSPAASTARLVMGISFHNNHATQTCLLRITHTDGTTVEELMHTTLLAGESLQFDEYGNWLHRDANTDDYPFEISYEDRNLGITGTKAETMPRELCEEVSRTTVSGTLYLYSVFLRKGQVVSNISFFSSTVAAATPTNGFFALYSLRRDLLASSANFTTEAWAANTIKTKAMTAAYTVPISQIYYIALMTTATTTASLKGVPSIAGGELYANNIAGGGSSNTGLTTVLPNPANQPTAITHKIWAAIT